MRYSLLSITGFVVFVASSSMSIAAGTSCKSHYYQTECQEDAACNWSPSEASAKPIRSMLDVDRLVSFIASPTAVIGTRKPVGAPKAQGPRSR
jgi:hypothetical protein